MASSDSGANNRSRLLLVARSRHSSRTGANRVSEIPRDTIMASSDHRTNNRSECLSHNNSSRVILKRTWIAYQRRLAKKVYENPRNLHTGGSSSSSSFRGTKVNPRYSSSPILYHPVSDNLSNMGSSWSIEVKPGSPYVYPTQQDGRRLVIRKASLGDGSTSTASSCESYLYCSVGYSVKSWLIGILDYGETELLMNLELLEAKNVIFKVHGGRPVHVSGYYIGGREQGETGKQQVEFNNVINKLSNVGLE